jgi:hypothetical protein
MYKKYEESEGTVIQAERVTYLPIQLVIGVLSPGMKLPGH